MDITFVWIQGENGEVGKDNGIPWSMSNDLKQFKKITMTGDMVMGRKTFESFPNGALPGRKNLVITRQEDYDEEGAIVFHNKEDVLEYARQDDKPLHVIGGGEIFKMFLDDVTILHLTLVHDTFDADVYMPDIDYSEFELVEEKEGIVDEKNPYPHTYYKYVRK